MQGLMAGPLPRPRRQAWGPEYGPEGGPEWGPEYGPEGRQAWHEAEGAYPQWDTRSQWYEPGHGSHSGHYSQPDLPPARPPPSVLPTPHYDQYPCRDAQELYP